MAYNRAYKNKKSCRKNDEGNYQKPKQEFVKV